MSTNSKSNPANTSTVLTDNELKRIFPGYKTTYMFVNIA